MGSVIQSGTLSGLISTSVKLGGVISAHGSLVGEISKPIIVDYRGVPYDGEYIVTPETSTQVLPTKEKQMRDDLTVLAIPYYETTNETGGNTVYIGMEVEIDG